MRKCTVDYDLLVSKISDLMGAVADQHVTGCLDGVTSPEYKQYQNDAIQLHTDLITYLASNIDWGEE